MGCVALRHACLLLLGCQGVTVGDSARGRHPCHVPSRQLLRLHGPLLLEQLRVVRLLRLIGVEEVVRHVLALVLVVLVELLLSLQILLLQPLLMLPLKRVLVELRLRLWLLLSLEFVHHLLLGLVELLGMVPTLLVLAQVRRGEVSCRPLHWWGWVMCESPLLDGVLQRSLGLGLLSLVQRIQRSRLLSPAGGSSRKLRLLGWDFLLVVLSTVQHLLLDALHALLQMRIQFKGRVAHDGAFPLLPARVQGSVEEGLAVLLHLLLLVGSRGTPRDVGHGVERPPRGLPWHGMVRKERAH